MADMATHWRRPTARPMVTVAELLGRVAAVPRGSACTPTTCQHEPGVSVDALLRREGRGSTTPEGGSPGQTRRAAVAVSTFLAAGSVVGVALSSNSTEYVLGNTAQPVDAPPVGPSAPTSGGQNLVPGQQAPVLDPSARTGALAAGSGPSSDWTAVAFPPTAGAGAGDPSAASAETSDTTADAASEDAAKVDAEPRGDDNNSASDDDRDDGSRSSRSDSRDSESTAAGSTPRDDGVVSADDGSAEPAPPASETVVPGGVARPGAAEDGTESGEASGDGAGSVDDSDGQDTPSTAGDSTDEGTDAVDGHGDATDSGADESASDSDATSDTSSIDGSDSATEDSGGGGDSATESAA